MFGYDMNLGKCEYIEVHRTQNFKYKNSEITKILFSTKEVVRKRFSGLLASAFPSSSSSSATSSSGEPP